VRGLRGRGRRQRSPRGAHLRHHTGGRQLLVQLLVDAAHRRAHVALAQLDQHQVNFRGQLAPGEGLVDGHPQVFGADRIEVGVQFQAADQPAEAAVEAGQHRLEIAQQHGGEVAHRQPRFQDMLGNEAQAFLGRPGQGGFGGQRMAVGQRGPGLVQVGGKGRGDLVPAPAQFAHGIQEQQLRRAGIAGSIEQGIVKPRQRRAESLAQGGQDSVPRTLELGRVTTRRSHLSGRTHHSGRLPTFSGTTDIMDIATTGTPHVPDRRW